MKTIHQQLIIPETLAKSRLDQALAQLLPQYSRTQIKTWITNGQVLINHQPSQPKYKVRAGEVILIEASEKAPLSFEAEAIPLNIVYEDEALLVVNKPAGLVVHPGAGNPNKTLLNGLLHYLPALSHLPRAGILHRLDKNTSGLLLIAKTNDALKKLTYQLKKRTLLREYQAIVTGLLVSGGVIDAPIQRHYRERTRMAVTSLGKKAITHFRLVEKYRAHTRLTLRLETGRTHQIRVHLAHIHHPLVGDSVYGGRLLLARGMTPLLIQALQQFKRQALHAETLGCTHPLTKEWVTWHSPLPEDMTQLIAILRKDVTMK